jgi:hypothetical protein
MILLVAQKRDQSFRVAMKKAPALATGIGFGTDDGCSKRRLCSLEKYDTHTSGGWSMAVHTVLVYTQLQFDQNFAPQGNFFVATKPNAEMLAVVEAPQGVVTTYWFRVNPGEPVQVFSTENNVIIPARCYKKELGNLVQCGKG